MKGLKGRSRFIDTVTLYVKGGFGGAGLPKFGGIGGAGGNVYVKADKGTNMKKIKFAEPTLRYKAGPGGNSKQFVLVGKPGQHVTIKAPVGTICTTDNGVLLGEVNKAGESVLVCRGGDGGSPTNGFLGQAGEAKRLKLLLKTIADIGLVGFPNAGKSTLLNMISNARPRVASYPFTTLRPYVGVLHYNDLRQITMADLPGLIEGAWANKGLGHSFLKHIERTKLLLIVVDINGFRLSKDYPHRSPIETLLLLNKELELYDASLLNKPAVLIVNKMDLPGAQEKYEQLLEQLDKGRDLLASFPESVQPSQLLQLHEVISISAKKNEDSVLYLKERVRKLLDIVHEYSTADETSLQRTDGDSYLFAPKLIEKTTNKFL